MEESESEVAQLCLTVCDPMDCSLSGSFVHGIFQARVLEWGAIGFSSPSWTALQINILFAGSFGILAFWLVACSLTAECNMSHKAEMGLQEFTGRGATPI